MQSRRENYLLFLRKSNDVLFLVRWNDLPFQEKCNSILFPGEMKWCTFSWGNKITYFSWRNVVMYFSLEDIRKYVFKFQFFECSYFLNFNFILLAFSYFHIFHIFMFSYSGLSADLSAIANDMQRWQPNCSTHLQSRRNVAEGYHCCDLGHAHHDWSPPIKITI